MDWIEEMATDVTLYHHNLGGKPIGPIVLKRKDIKADLHERTHKIREFMKDFYDYFASKE